MAAEIGMNNPVLCEWLQSGRTARICGLDIRPKPSRHWAGAPQCITQGQATAIFFDQMPQGNTWLIKIFRPGRRPADDYLQTVESYLPGAAAFFACMQRRFLTAEHLDQRASSFKHTALADLLEGSIMMPKVPGMAWTSTAEDLRAGVLNLPWIRRLKLALALVRCVELLEAGQCSHRDLSAANVFVDDDAIWLIDFDCLYHPDLPFQANTTIGTMGYIAPFLKAMSGNSDPALSWCRCADRFSLAVLVAEILLTSPDLARLQEDGTLFSQTQIDEPENPFVQEVIDRLRGRSKPCGLLLERAFTSATFEQCPSPQEWISALRWTLRPVQAGHHGDGRGTDNQRFIRVLCAGCGAAFSIARIKHDELQQKGKSILCKYCLSRQFAESSITRAQRRLDFPEVSCEHCRKIFPLPRHRLNALRHRGRPILCSTCLPDQLKKWQKEVAEQDLSHPRVACANCQRRFHLRKEIRDHLAANGKAALCPTCLSQTRGRKLDGANEPPLKSTVRTLKPWLL